LKFLQLRQICQKQPILNQPTKLLRKLRIKRNGETPAANVGMIKPKKLKKLKRLRVQKRPKTMKMGKKLKIKLT